MNFGIHQQRYPFRVLLCAAVIIFMVLLMLPLAQETAQAAPGDVVLVSTDAAGAQANANNAYSSMSADGRYTAFASVATNLIPGVTGTQIYRKDLRTGEVRLVSADVAGAQGNSASIYTSISSDGRYVAFQSQAPNLVSPATTGQQAFRKDMVTGEVKLCSADAAGVQGNASSQIPVISSDGRYVVFFSGATNLVTPPSGFVQVFRKDLMTGEVKLCSADAAGTQGNNVSAVPSVSSDGRYVAFYSTANNLIPGFSGTQIYRKDLVTGEIKLCSASVGGTQGNGGSVNPVLSSDGRYVAFNSSSTNLITPATSTSHVFRKDMMTGEVLLASANAAGTQGNGGSGLPSISSDGRYVAFDSNATNLVTPATSGGQVFRKDLATGEVLLASANAAGVQGVGINLHAYISSDGRYVAFTSTSTNLVTPANTGQQIFRKELAAPYYFYFAEGYTGSGFQEYLCLGNAGANPITVKTTYLYKDGTTKDETYGVPTNSRATINVNLAAGADKEVSVKCESDSAFIAERPMYFNYEHKWTGGHDAVGATAPSLAWYFAEGYTGAGFDEWICVLNPGDLPANLTFYFQTQEEGERKVEGFSVPAHSRGSFKANQLLGGGSYQTSLKLTSDQMIVAERPMYFSYSGTADYGWTGGSCVMGSTMLSSSYYFAEGTTRAGFEEWLTLQNPGPTDIVVDAVYFFADGTTVPHAYSVQAGRRTTILVNSPTAAAGAERDVSVRLTCPTPFLAERPMYFDYQGLGHHGWTGGHCVIGATAPSHDWFFAEGYTGGGFEEWLCVQNPNAADAALTITYYPEGGGTPIVRTHNVAAHSRFTVPVNADAGANQSISAKVSSSVWVIVERPMYFNFNNAWSGGHDVVGYVP